MKCVINKESLENNIVVFMVIATIIDMGGGLYIKYIAYFIAILYCFRFNPKVFLRSDYSIIFFIFIFWPILSIGIGMLNAATFSVAFNNVSPFIPAILMLFLANKDNINKFLSTINKTVLFIAYLVILFYFLFLTNNSLVSPLFSFMESVDMGFFGNKIVEGEYMPGVYFKSTLFFNFSLILYLFNRHFFKSLIIFVAILLSFSKAAILVSLISVIYFFIHDGFVIKKCSLFIKSHTFLIGVLLSMIIVYFVVSFKDYVELVILYINNAILGKSGTTQVRMLHIESIVKLFREHPCYLIFGQGAGTFFYTTGFNSFVNNIELDHLNSIRKFGLVWAIPFYCFITYVFFKLRNVESNKILAISFMLTFILVGSNPLMINPLFLMMIILMYKFQYYKIPINV